jgi:hypothetical protein
MESKEYVNVISYGAGKQSTYMLLNALEGKYKFKPDFAIYSDLQCETKATEMYVNYIKSYVKNRYDFDIIIVSEGNLMKDIEDYLSGKTKRGCSIPLFSGDTGAPINRQCTSDYKIKPIRQYLQKARNGKKIRQWIGISADESERMKTPNVKYIEHYYPLVENRIRIDEIKQWFKDNNIPEPMKSSCLICPFHSHQYWQNLKKNFPVEFETACDFDEKIRQLPKMKSKTYLYRKCIPLKDADFTMQPSLFPELIEECEGLCGL